MTNNREIETLKSELSKTLSNLIQLLVDEPDDVVVDMMASQSGTLLINIQVNKADIGKVIGKKGNHANALRTLICAIVAPYNYRAILEIHE